MTIKNKRAETKLEVMLFTDPYCSWCWASEPMFFALSEKYREQLHFVYVFGGLVKDMDDFNDEENGIADALAVLPHWREVSEYSGQPIDEYLWEDIAKIRHFSSWPANIACKAAFLQGEEVGERFLRNMRRSVQAERKIISLKEVYFEIAKNTQGLDLEQFRTDLQNQKAQKAFEEDLALCVQFQANVFPTLLFHRTDTDRNRLTKENAALIGGHHPTQRYEEIIKRLVPDIQTYEARDGKELLSIYGPMTERELAEIHHRSVEAEQNILEELFQKGEIGKKERVRGNIWYRL